MREGTGLESMNAVDEFDDENPGHLSHDNGKSDYLEAT